MNSETPVESQLKPAVDNVQEITDWKEKNKQAKEAKKAKKSQLLEAKRQKAYAERRQRHINNGVDPKKVDMVMAAEDYAEMPTEKKLHRLEGIVQQSFQRFAQELHNLRYNDGVLADAMDVNFKAFSKMLQHLGLPLEEHKKFMDEAQTEMALEKHRDAQAHAEAQKKQAEEDMAASEQKNAEIALRAAEESTLAIDQAVANEKVSAPEGATEFGG